MNKIKCKMENSVISRAGRRIANWFRRAKFRAATAQRQGIFRLTGGVDRKKYRDNFANFDKILAIILLYLMKFSRYFCHVR